MKLMRYLLILMASIISLKVYADTCSYKEQTILNNDFSNVKITYEVINDDKINILIYNLTDNIYVTFNDPITKEEKNIYYFNTSGGKYEITKDTSEVLEYKFQIRSNIAVCYGNILTTKKVIKPAYNEFSTLSICNNEKLKNHSYCQKYITSKINKSESEVIKVLEDFLASKVDRMTTKPVEEEKVDIKTIITYSSVGFIIAVVVVILLLIRKKRGEL